MRDLENLKKQAKLILRWHRERYYPVAAQIRVLMPRFLNMPDSEILAASFKLSDAQEMVARQHGFDSWQALKTGLSTTSRKVKSSLSMATISPCAMWWKGRFSGLANYRSRAVSRPFLAHR